MRTRNSLMIAAIFGAGAITVLSGSASARIVCNDDGDCWHSATTYEYPAGAHVTVHEDSWKFGDGDRFRWREHEGRGYWHGHDWTAF